MNTWAPLWSGIVDSSIWDEPDYVVKVFLTMLALKDPDFVYRGDAYKLSKRSRKTEVEVLDALKVLASADTRRVEPQQYDGRRIQAVDGGWLILNGLKYREMIEKEKLREKNRRSQEAFRQRRKQGGNGRMVLSAVERAAAALEAAGKPEEAARAVELEEGLREAEAQRRAEAEANCVADNDPLLPGE